MILIHRQKQFFTKFFAILILSISFIGCSKDGYIVIDLEGEHLENTPSGFWLDVFDIDYSFSSERLKTQVVNQLKTGGALLDEYTHKEGANTVKTYVYKFREYKILLEYYDGGIWEGPKVIPFQEYYNGGLNSWVTIEFKEGIPYSKLLPNNYMEINQNRKYEHTATIKSTIDQERRLFLFGYGSNCQRISLF